MNDKSIFKKSPDELAEYLGFKKRGFKIESKKGKRPYKRNEKHKIVPSSNGQDATLSML